jgi:glucose/arabinose dehydrogenase
MKLSRVSSLLVISAALTGCGDSATLPLAAGTGPRPQLPPPHKTLVPTINVAPAKGWPAGDRPAAAPGLVVTAYATGLDHPRWLTVLPNGDVLVAETNAPPKPEDGKGVKGWLMKQFMKRAGAGTPSANRITLLRGIGTDGSAATRAVFLENLRSPFGMALVGKDFYVANTDGIVRFPYGEGATRIDAAPTDVAALPGGPLNHHWTKNVVASIDGSRLYATVGSNSNVGENGMAAEEGRAAIWEIDARSGQGRIFASGLRNPNGMAWGSDGTLWTVANERDELGSDLVPDYLTSVRDGAFYGWPYSYYGQHVDDRVQPQRPELVAKAVPPDYALGPHTASLGLVSVGGIDAAGAVQRRGHVRRPARFVEPQALQRLPRHLRAVLERPARGRPGRRADRIPQPRGRGQGPPGRRRDRQDRRPARRRRRRQRRLARHRRRSLTQARLARASRRAGYFLLCDQSLSAASVFSTWRLGFRLW